MAFNNFDQAADGSLRQMPVHPSCLREQIRTRSPARQLTAHLKLHSPPMLNPKNDWQNNCTMADARPN